MDFVIIANAWTAANDNPTGKHQIALQLAKKGHRVLWIEGSGMRKPSAGSSADRSRILSKIKKSFRGIREAEPNIWITSPLIIPLPTQTTVRAINSIIYLITGLACKLIPGFKKPSLINFLPIVPLSEKLWPWKTVYFCVDRWDKFDMYDTEIMSNVDNACCRNADIVLTTSADLQNRCKTKNPRSFLIGHGVNWSHFAAPLNITIQEKDSKNTSGKIKSNAQNISANAELRPDDLPPGKIIGFFGLLSEWVDQKLIIELAGAVGTKASIVLIGRADVDITELESQPNIHILGAKAFSELPPYTAFFNVAVIPFIINELTIAVNPIKLREMLAAGCPVVSTDLPEVHAVARNTPYVATAEDNQNFIDAVVKQLDNNLTLQDRKNISNTMQNETWSSKVDKILENIAQI